MSGGVKGRDKVRLRAGSGFALTGDLSPLRSTGGVVFPYTPTIQVGHAASYGTYDVTHSVYQTNYWVNTRNPSIQITAQFTAQTQEDANYSAAAMHFFKSCTKGEFGRSSGNPGVPPPVLRLSGYGPLNFANVPVVVASFSYTLPEDLDYVETDYGNIPSMYLASLDLLVQHVPVNVRNNFNAAAYRSGSILGKGFI
jgi:hypothetical protein